ncbi:MAG: inorganic pyrophosphatase [Clostridiales bacterium]|nr:inorganic pyrophosphatase [Clostridiales bacterium]
MKNPNEYKEIIGCRVAVTVDRPLGSVHPEHEDLVYSVNYGFVDGNMGGDGEWQDVYILGVNEAVSTFTGVVIAVIVRENDAETKWVVAPEGVNFTQKQIADAVNFQEKYFCITIVA